jgi:hypothetical protein
MQKEENVLYEEVDINTSAARYKARAPAPRPTPNTHVELKENVAYGHVHY